MEFIKNNIKIIAVFVFIFLNLTVFKFFPTDGRFQSVVTLFVFFVLIPFIYNKFILKQPLSFLGLRIGNFKKGLILSGIALVLSLIIFYIIFNYSGFVDKYRLSPKVMNNFSYFIYYEVIIVLALNFVYEFFFRGFLLFNSAGVLKYGSIFLQWFVFLALIIFNVQFDWNMLPYVVFFPFAGWIAYESKSIFYSLVTQTILILIIDSVFIKLSAL